MVKREVTDFRQAVAMDGEGITCEVRLQMKGQTDLETLPWLWREKGGKPKERRGQDDSRVSRRGTVKDKAVMSGGHARARGRELCLDSHAMSSW